MKRSTAAAIGLSMLLSFVGLLRATMTQEAIAADPQAPAAHATDGETIDAVVVQPRSFGHVVGDVLTQRVLLGDGERRIELAAMPPADRVNLWLERRAPRIISDDEGRRWLAIDYQVINAPRALTTAALPALSLATMDRGRLKIDAWPISIGPLASPSVVAEGDPRTLRPDRVPAEAPTARLRWQLAAWLIAFAATCAAWLAWVLWRDRRDSLRLPFAQAWRRLKHLEARGEHEGEEAWLALHRAFDDAAGYVVHAGSLPRLFIDAPRLQPLRDDIALFYRSSSERFFSRSPEAARFPLLDLSCALSRIERRAQR